MTNIIINSINKQEYLALRNGYYRRLLNLNSEIRKYRKNKLCTKELNEQRKNVNRYYNLLDLYKDNINDPKAKSIYLELLKEYKNG